MARELMRQGGRSARIQKEVHAAVRSLLETMNRGALTVPLIAERAGVPPSTIYRRWGDLAQLLADVAVERLRPVADPDDTGTTAGDLEAYVLEYAEEMSSKVGQAMLRDVMADAEAAGAPVKCCQYTYDNLGVILARAHGRGERGFDPAEAVDHIIAPIVYHILSGDRDTGPAYCRSLLARFPVDSRKAA
jgi:AcrR family transcriptional regulator